MERIYIIEDDENIRNLLKIALEGFGYQAESFETAEEGLARMKAVSYTHLERKGPLLVRKGFSVADSVPFSTENANVFLNGVASNLAAVKQSRCV